MAETLRIGDKVLWRSSSWDESAPVKEVTVTGLAIIIGDTANDTAEIDHVGWDKDFVADLGNGKWAYANQLTPITKSEDKS